MQNISKVLTVAKDASQSDDKPGVSMRSEEAMVFCPGCKAIQTLWIEKNRLVPTSRFIQQGNDIYHVCGSNQPCRLYFNL